MAVVRSESLVELRINVEDVSAVSTPVPSAVEISLAGG